MTENEYNFLLEDRIAKIQAINEQYDLLNNSYISFSGGKDSTILHYLVDMALPNNKIPRLYLNTGIEYKDIRMYVKELAENDDRIIIINSGVNIKEVLNKYGFPFKSKEHSLLLSTYQNSGYTKSVRKYLKLEPSSRQLVCPNKLKLQFTKDYNLKCSDKCCYKLKKEPAKKWAKENNKSIILTGIRKSEGGLRVRANCIVTDKDNKLVKFHPLLVVDDEFENAFIKFNNIRLCKLYNEPFNFTRTGCKGCPFALDLQKELDVLEEKLPFEFKQCVILWGKVYDEYRRLGYRLKPKQISIFDF